ncbi:MAG: HAD family phosphatase [Actinomycetes bacterium]|jgi:epoxide hydrolase-like predicted phosphatase
MSESPPRGLIVDWGGVLTGDTRSVVRAWAEQDGIDLDAYASVMRDWFGHSTEIDARANPIYALERGEIELPHYEDRLAAELTTRTGNVYVAEGLLQRMFEFFEHAPDMTGLVRRARGLGIRTALLSNSWGNDYPREGWDEMFDVIVISGEVGMRKPEPRIYDHTLDLLGLPAAECVFVDDLSDNVKAAVGVGMIGVRHVEYETTLAELETLFGRSLS